MRSLIVTSLCLVFVFLGSAYADFSLVSGINAPQAPYGASEVTGLSAAGDNLFVVVRADTSSFIFLVRPEDGEVLRQAEVTGDVASCKSSYRQLVSGAAYDLAGDLYLVGDACGAILEIMFGADSSYVADAYTLDGVETPTGLVVEDDTVYTTDWDDETLIKSIGTTVISEYALPSIDRPAALATYGNNLLVASFLEADWIYEITREAAPVETHSVEGLSCPNLHAAAFLGDHLYLAGGCDSIFIFEPSEEGIWVPEGDSIPVEVVPGELVVGFDSVSAPGWLYVSVSDSQLCPAPSGVELFPPFYDLNTTAYFEYVADVELTFSDSLLPPDYDVDKLRIFKRPSGACQDFRDVTIDWVEILPTLKVIMRSRSEDDEFSVFALGLDSRRPREVVELKFAYLGGIMASNGDVIPPDVFAQITDLYDDAISLYYRGNSLAAQGLVNDIADLVRATEAIPHTFDGTPGSNVAGGIMSRSHTLAFSLMYSEGEAVTGEAAIVPGNIIIGLKQRWVTAYFEVPDGFVAADIDPLNIFMDGYAQALPDSVTIVDYDSDGQPEVRALFLQADVEDLLSMSGPVTVHLTGFVDGFELRADAAVNVCFPHVSIMSEEPVVAGGTYRVVWSGVFDDLGVTYTLCYSLDAGQTWEEVVSGISQLYYYWTAPDIDTATGLLRVRTLRNGDEILISDSDPFAILRPAGVEVGVEGLTDKIMITPNPSMSGFRIHLALSGNQPVSVGVYTVAGGLIRTLVDGQSMSGVCHLTWEGKNGQGAPVAAGVYMIVLKEGEQITIKKMILER